MEDSVVTSEDSARYDALTGETQLGPGAKLNSTPRPRDLVVPDPGQSGVRVVGTSQRGGVPTTVLEFPSQAAEPRDVRRQASMAYVAPYFVDVQPVGLKRQIEIRQSDRLPVLARVLVVSVNGATTVASEQEMVTSERVAGAPADVFSTAGLPGTRTRMNAGAMTALPSMKSLTIDEGAARLGRSPILLDASAGLQLGQIMTAIQQQALSAAPASLRDLVFAAQRGDAVRFQYSDQRGRTLVVQEGNVAALRESAQQSGATWATSRSVQVSVGGKPLVGWLLSFDPEITPGTRQSGLIFESDGLLVDIRAFGFSDDELLSTAAALK